MEVFDGVDDVPPAPVRGLELGALREAQSSCDPPELSLLLRFVGSPDAVAYEVVAVDRSSIPVLAAALAPSGPADEPIEMLVPLGLRPVEGCFTVVAIDQAGNKNEDGPIRCLRTDVDAGVPPPEDGGVGGLDAGSEPIDRRPRAGRLPEAAEAGCASTSSQPTALLLLLGLLAALRRRGRLGS